MSWQLHKHVTCSCMIYPPCRKLNQSLEQIWPPFREIWCKWYKIAVQHTLPTDVWVCKVLVFQSILWGQECKIKSVIFCKIAFTNMITKWQLNHIHAYAMHNLELYALHKCTIASILSVQLWQFLYSTKIHQNLKKNLKSIQTFSLTGFDINKTESDLGSS